VLKRIYGRADTSDMHTIFWLAKRLGIGQQRVGGPGLLLFILVGVPAIIFLVARLMSG
jgi:hypothetical protein